MNGLLWEKERLTGYLGWIMVEDESPRAETDSDGVVAEDGKYMCRQIHR